MPGSAPVPLIHQEKDLDQDIYSVVTPNGVCTKILYKGHEISVAQEDMSAERPFKIGQEFHRVEIRVYKDTRNVSLEFETLTGSDRDEYSPSGKTLMLLLIEIDSRF